MQKRWIALGIAAGAACFAGGVVAARYLGGAGAPPPAPSSTGVSLFPADAGGPRIMIDPDKIELLPDASLRLDLPPGFDGGTP